MFRIWSSVSDTAPLIQPLQSDHQVQNTCGSKVRKVGYGDRAAHDPEDRSLPSAEVQIGKDIMPFEFMGYQLTYIVDADGNIWFIATEVCKILGINNTPVDVSSLDNIEKSTIRITDGGPKRNIINESGLYSLIIRSRKPGAKKFNRWVTHEALPPIRKTGRYV